ncbi:PQQ-binding-like beta-propeller repeat protein [Botrimarina sp.]|uniref:PQQ-binding-like beta-propeller repeat protein n=1 Tax=Botrimarina sp. TaxID=2795802 RepID=UPI0032EC1D08
MSGRVAVGVALLVAVSSADGRDWARFRGPNGEGTTADAAPPVEWGPGENVAWEADLPGPGSSSPIVVGDLVLVTCYTGYGLDQENPGDQQDLKRCLIAYDKRSGEQRWRVDVPAELPEDEYAGMFAQHGYASHTPASDGERVYAYFGKSGALAYDLQGKELWQTDCGDGFGANGWGSAASPLIYGDLVICTATAESESLIALDKKTGKEVWRRSEEGWDGVWGTPVLAEADGRTDLVFGAPQQMLGMDPATGETRWTCRGVETDAVSTSPVAHDGVVYIISGRGGALAVRAGGEGEVDDSHVLWRAGLRGSISTPVYHDGRLYGIGREGVSCVDAQTGERVYQARFEAVAEGPEAQQQEPGAQPQEAQPQEQEEGDQPRRGRRGGGGGGRFGSIAYSSPVVAGDLMYHFGRHGAGHVVRLAGEFQQVASNPPLSEGDYSGTPALSDGAMYVRSSRKLYCVREGGESVALR